MDNLQKVKDWINENFPALAGVYQNKYVGMAYDRFASLPPKQQKQTLIGAFGGTIALVFLYLLWSYYSLWSTSSKADDAYAMVNLVQQYQRSLNEKGPQIQLLQRNSQLASPGQFKDHILAQARSASISPRMVTVDEKPDRESEEDSGKASKEIKVKQASVSLEKVNLAQLKNFVQNLEYGNYNLHVSSIKITNDDKMRGYMRVDLAVIAYLFQSEETVTP